MIPTHFCLTALITFMLSDPSTWNWGAILPSLANWLLLPLLIGIYRHAKKFLSQKFAAMVAAEISQNEGFSGMLAQRVVLEINGSYVKSATQELINRDVAEQHRLIRVDIKQLSDRQVEMHKTNTDSLEQIKKEIDGPRRAKRKAAR